MTLIDLENLSPAELKALTKEQTDAVAASPDELRARYLKTLIDAKTRDEKLAEQGKTITTLQDAFEQLKAAAQADQLKLEGIGADLQKKLQTAEAAVSQQKTQAVAQAAKHAETLTAMQASLASETERAKRLKAQAVRHQSAVFACQKLLNEAVAAESIEQADAGA